MSLPFGKLVHLGDQGRGLWLLISPGTEPEQGRATVRGPLPDRREAELQTTDSMSPSPKDRQFFLTFSLFESNLT